LIGAEIGLTVAECAIAVKGRGCGIKHLEDALAIAEEIEDGTTCYLIEEALDEARARLFVPRARRP
jgi:hypothetical protein